MAYRSEHGGGNALDEGDVFGGKQPRALVALPRDLLRSDLERLVFQITAHRCAQPTLAPSQPSHRQVGATRSTCKIKCPPSLLLPTTLLRSLARVSTRSSNPSLLLVSPPTRRPRLRLFFFFLDSLAQFATTRLARPVTSLDAAPHRTWYCSNAGGAWLERRRNDEICLINL